MCRGSRRRAGSPEHRLFASHPLARRTIFLTWTIRILTKGGGRLISLPRRLAWLQREQIPTWPEVKTEYPLLRHREHRPRRSTRERYLRDRRVIRTASAARWQRLRLDPRARMLAAGSGRDLKPMRRRRLHLPRHRADHHDECRGTELDRHARGFWSAFRLCSCRPRYPSSESLPRELGSPFSSTGSNSRPGGSQTVTSMKSFSSAALAIATGPRAAGGQTELAHRCSRGSSAQLRVKRQAAHQENLVQVGHGQILDAY